jgi:hypothetical protein
MARVDCAFCLTSSALALRSSISSKPLGNSCTAQEVPQETWHAILPGLALPLRCSRTFGRAAQPVGSCGQGASPPPCRAAPHQAEPNGPWARTRLTFSISPGEARIEGWRSRPSGPISPGGRRGNGR